MLFDRSIEFNDLFVEVNIEGLIFKKSFISIHSVQGFKYKGYSEWVQAYKKYLKFKVSLQKKRWTLKAESIEL